MQADLPDTRAALAEVESLLDHLFHHPNTPVFIGHRLIQRFVTSNPSPSYIQDVGEAFRTGAYAGTTYGGTYGDLRATVAAVLLHPEARGPQSPETHGSLREPLVKLVHFMRAMEYADNRDREVVMANLRDTVGQWPFQSPTVFNFYSAEYQPANFPTGLVGPEFEIFTPPLALGFLNGMLSLVEHGISNCGSGFGIATRVCGQGVLNFTENATVSETLNELDLLLTGGRLAHQSVVRDAYEAASGQDRLKAAQQAVLLAPEFHAMGDPLPAGTRQPSPPENAPEPRSYKAAVMLFLGGGADTFNLLVPAECSLYDEYLRVRSDVALRSWQINTISTTGQGCARFGVHHRLPFVKDLYNRQKAAFVTNIGALVEPLTKQQFTRGGGSRCVGLFSHSDQVQAAQTLQCQTPGAAPKGAGGRIADAVAASGFRTTSFSVSGTSTWSQGFQTNQEIIDSRNGAVRLERYEELRGLVDNVTNRRHNNVFSDEYTHLFGHAIESSENLGTYLSNVTLRTQYMADTGLARQLHQVARLIATRVDRKAERDFFYVQLGGFDTHSQVEEVLDAKFGEINEALRGFVAELEAQGAFDSTVLVTASDFGRSLTSNGAGTDHAWAGNHFVLGGSVQGGHVFNDFPASLLEGNEQDAGRGRLIPKYPWESMMVPIAEWMGVNPSQYNQVFPNLGNFNLSSHIIGRDALFAS